MCRQTVWQSMITSLVLRFMFCISLPWELLLCPRHLKTFHISIVGNDAVITWDAVTQTIIDTPIVPDGYIVLYSEDDEHYFYLSQTTNTTLTHFMVAHFRPQMFYQVFAYKEYRRSQSDYLQSLKTRPDKVSLEEITAYLNR